MEFFIYKNVIALIISLNYVLLMNSKIFIWLVLTYYDTNNVIK